MRAILTGHARALVPMLLGVCLMALAPPAVAQSGDSDGDGLSDAFETRWGVTAPDAIDSDRDGIVDPAEDEDGDDLSNLGEQRFGTDPGDPDSDGDGTPDGDEDTDADGRSDAEEQDERPVPEGLRPSLAEAHDDANGVGRWCGVPEGRSALRHCAFGDPQSETRIVLMGDSHAHALLLPFKRAAWREGWYVQTLIKGACIPLLGLENGLQLELDGGRSCRRWKQNAIDWLHAGEPPDLVVITHSDRYVLAGPDGGRYDKETWPARWEAAVGRTVEALPEASSALILGDVPHNYGDPVACLREDPSDIGACSSPRQAPEERTVERALRAGAEASGAAFGTLYDSICTYDPCPLVHGDVLVWRDRSHLSATFSGRLTAAVEALLREVMP